MNLKETTTMPPHQTLNEPGDNPFTSFTSSTGGKETPATHIPGNEISETMGRILVVDDEPDILKLLEFYLKRKGHLVSAFLCGMEALKAFRKAPESYDLVITDLSMPTMEGDVFSYEINKIRAGTPILLCTGNNRGLKAGKAAAPGITAVLTKPLSLSDLSRKIQQLLGAGESRGGGSN